MSKNPETRADDFKFQAIKDQNSRIELFIDDNVHDIFNPKLANFVMQRLSTHTIFVTKLAFRDEVGVPNSMGALMGALIFRTRSFISGPDFRTSVFNVICRI